MGMSPLLEDGIDHTFFSPPSFAVLLLPLEAEVADATATHTNATMPTAMVAIHLPLSRRALGCRCFRDDT
jgi:hypothetical protein